MNHKMVHYCAQGTLSISINGHGAQQTNQTRTHTLPHLAAERITIKKEKKRECSFSSKWFLLLKCLFSFTFLLLLFFLYFRLSVLLSQSISKDTHFAVTCNSYCHFLENIQFIQCINNAYKSKQIIPTTYSTCTNKQHLKIAQLLNIMLYFRLCFILPTVFFSLPFLWPPPKEPPLNLPTHNASLQLILTPRTYCGTRPLQTQRTTSRPHYILSKAPCRLPLVGPVQNTTQ